MEPRQATAGFPFAGQIVVFLWEADELDLAIEPLQGDEELLSLLDRAAEIALVVQDQQRV